jgi:hypothetical protein
MAERTVRLNACRGPKLGLPHLTLSPKANDFGSLNPVRHMQPYFSALFRKDKIGPLHFRVRAGACAVHDVQFLSSYLHDARFHAHSITRHRKKVTIMLERDCWEFGYENPKNELHVAKCRLTITPVSALHWETSLPADPNRELWIESIYLGAAHWENPMETSQLVLTAPHDGWKLTLTLALSDELFGDIRLDDLEKPYLYSKRKD